MLFLYAAILAAAVVRAADDGTMVFDLGSEDPAEPSTQKQPTEPNLKFDKGPDFSKKEQRTFSPEDLAKCDGRDGRRLCVAFEGGVYDVTDFVGKHPGGQAVLREVAGRDATSAMRASPMPPKAYELLRRFRVGTLSQPAAADDGPEEDSDAGGGGATGEQTHPDCSYGNQLLNLCEIEQPDTDEDSSLQLGGW